jgi:hypothetical protein
MVLVRMIFVSPILTSWTEAGSSLVRDAILTPKVYSPRPIAGSDNNREITTTPLMLLKRPRARAVKETRE